MIIVGLTGGIRHGKSTFADMLAHSAASYAHWETSEVIIEVANALRFSARVHPPADDIGAINRWLGPLPQAVTSHVHTEVTFEDIMLTPQKVAGHPELYNKLFEYLSHVQAHPEQLEELISYNNKNDFRSLLQWLGGYLVKVIGDGIWYDEIVRRLRVAERSGIKLATVSGVRFPGDAERLRNANGFILEIQRTSMEELDKQDVTERERSLIKPDSIIVNDSDLSALEACATQVFADLQIRSIKPSYRASDFSAA